MTAYEDGKFEIYTQWKEEVCYKEGDQTLSFPAGWGVNPPSLYVPSDRIWDEVMPDWLRGRRAEVAARLAKYSEHVLEDTDDWP